MQPIDISRYFDDIIASDAAAQQKREKSPRGSLLNLCKAENRGLALVRPIVDELGRTTKTLTDLVEVYESIPAFNDDGSPKLNNEGKQWVDYSNITVVAPENYNTRMFSLTASQSNLLTELIAKLRMYNEMLNKKILARENTATNLGVSVRSSLTFFWAKVIMLSDKSGKTKIDDGIVRLCKHVSASFATIMAKAVQTQTKIMGGSKDWMMQFFGRDPGQFNAITSISTEFSPPGVVGYATNIQFSNAAPYDLTEEDISTCVDLNTQVVDLTKFDEAVHANLLQRVTSYIDGVKKEQNAVLGFTPTNANETVQASPIGEMPLGAPQGIQTPIQEPVQPQQPVAPQPQATPVMPEAPAAQPQMTGGWTPPSPTGWQMPNTSL